LATEVAPQAQQAVGRCHLLKSLREAVERLLDRHSAQARAALEVALTPARGQAGPGPTLRAEQANRFERLHRSHSLPFAPLAILSVGRK
jgi:hypothetical protein